MNFLDKYWEVAAKIRSRAARSEFIVACVEYYYTGDEPEFKSEVAEVAFEGIRNLLCGSKSHADRRRTWRKQGANKTLVESELDANKSETADEQTALQQEQEQEQEEKEKEEKAKRKPAETDAIVARLNECCGTSFRASSERTQERIAARLNEGFTQDDFFAVIEHQADEWLGTEMSKYLRPETLFGSKFEGYLQDAKRDTSKTRKGEDRGAYSGAYADVF